MQATKVVTTSYSADGLPSFSLLDLNATTAPQHVDTAEVEEKLAQTNLGSETKGSQAEAPMAGEQREEASNSETTDLPKSKDPLRWFGILSPPSLHQAQSSASSWVATAVKLSTIDAEMKGVEIEIRRARKRKVKSQKQAEEAREEVAEHDKAALETRNTSTGQRSSVDAKT